ncbi:MAG TPA: patatin-like phospholipase family protein [Ktedonobacteraceae bacterium]|jgi:NTE family protein
MENRRFALFDGLPTEILTPLLKRLEQRHFPVSATVLAQGAFAGEMYLIQSGTADISIADLQGNEHHLTRVGPGATLGEMSLLTGAPISATVRADETSGLEVLVLTAEDFHQIAAAFPSIYRNLAAILSERLARTNQHTLRQYQDRIIMLLDDDSPPLLGYALACSIAWHTRKPILLVLLADAASLSDEIRSLATLLPSPPLATASENHARMYNTEGPAQKKAHLLLAAPDGAFAPPALGETLEGLCSQYAYVLLQTTEKKLLPSLTTRSVQLSGSQKSPLAESKNLQPGHIIQAWTDADSPPRPDQLGILHVPKPGRDDEEALRQGALPTSTPTGRTLGWAARDVARLKVGLALGAGAAKGYAHIGALRVLEQAGLPVDYIAGTSIGGVVAALYALGYSPEATADILDLVGQAAFRLTFPTMALLSNAGLRTRMQKITGQKRIEDLAVPLALVAADLLTWQEVVFQRGLLWAAVLASMSIPGIYSPQRIGAHTLIDGGVLNPVPSDIVAEMGADRVIAIKLSNREASPRKWADAAEPVSSGPSVLQTMLRSIELMQSKFSANTAATATILIEPILRESSGKGLRNFSQGRRFIPLGEVAAEEALPRLAAVFPWLHH